MPVRMQPQNNKPQQSCPTTQILKRDYRQHQYLDQGVLDCARLCWLQLCRLEDTAPEHRFWRPHVLEKRGGWGYLYPS